MYLSLNYVPFQVSDISAHQTRTEFEDQQKLVEELQRRLADAEFKLIEGEKLRKKLHNTILVIIHWTENFIDNKICPPN